MTDLGWSMTLALVVVIAVAAVALTPWLTRDRVLRGLARRRVLVFTTRGEVYDGLLARMDETSLVLVDVHARSGAVPVPMAAGELIQPRVGIAYLQHLAGDGGQLTIVPETAAPAASTG